MFPGSGVVLLNRSRDRTVELLVDPEPRLSSARKVLSRGVFTMELSRERDWVKSRDRGWRFAPCQFHGVVGLTSHMG